MVVKAEIKYEVIFQSKCEGHCCRIEVKHVLSTGIQFFWFLLDIQISNKSNKKHLEFLMWRFIWKYVRGWGRGGCKVQMWLIYLLQNIFLALKKKNAFSINLEREKTKLSFCPNYGHGTIIQTGITCKKILCYMRNSACWCFFFF